MFNKRLLLIFLIIFSVVVLIFLNFEKKEEVLTYPVEISIWDKILANISQVLKMGPGKKIEVDLSQQKVRTFEGNELIQELTVSTGIPEMPTPTGNFIVRNKSVMVYSNLANCWLPFWVGFTLDGLYGFHEIPICKEGRRGLEELGEPVSIGCIRLGVEDSENFYNWVEIGTPIVVYGDQLSFSKDSKEIIWCHDFNYDIKLGDRGNEVRALQTALAKDYQIYPESIISGWFGPLTQAAVIRFQEKYSAEILDTWNLTKGTGFVGFTTRNKLNQLYGCQ